MKGIMRKALLLGLGAAGVLSASGCGKEVTYRDIVDPCYPERYNYMARQELNEAMAPQMQNGHVLEQTVWNEHFETGSDKLTVGGQEHLKYLARRRPHADPVVFLQTAQDLAYDAAKPEDSTNKRAELNAKRTQAIQTYLNAYTASGHPFQVVLHDPADPGQSAINAQRAVAGMQASFQGSLQSAGGGAASGGGGR